MGPSSMPTAYALHFYPLFDFLPPSHEAPPLPSPSTQAFRTCCFIFFLFPSASSRFIPFDSSLFCHEWEIPKHEMVLRFAPRCCCCCLLDWNLSVETWLLMNLEQYPPFFGSVFFFYSVVVALFCVFVCLVAFSFLHVLFKLPMVPVLGHFSPSKFSLFASPAFPTIFLCLSGCTVAHGRTFSYTQSQSVYCLGLT